MSGKNRNLYVIVNINYNCGVNHTAKYQLLLINTYTFKLGKSTFCNTIYLSLRVLDKANKKSRSMWRATKMRKYTNGIYIQRPRWWYGSYSIFLVRYCLERIYITRLFTLLYCYMLGCLDGHVLLQHKLIERRAECYNTNSLLSE